MDETLKYTDSEIEMKSYKYKKYIAGKKSKKSLQFEVATFDSTFMRFNVT